jgi:dTDP-4-dehydrorhamnose 3,5-epimerase
MTPQKLSILGAHLVMHKVYPDHRGIFREWFKSEEIATIDRKFVVRQANYSNSKRNVIRGMHYSLAPEGQAKIVTCTSGAIIDVLIDLRVGSPSYLNVEYVELSEDSGSVIYIPSGVGHGFVVRSDSASITYLTSSGYAPTHEKSIRPTDPALGITWQIPVDETAILSKQDLESPTLSMAFDSGILPRF